MQKTVYFVDNKSNKRIVEKIKDFERFSHVSFLPLSPKKAISMITKIEQPRNQPAILIWSSGYYHHLSYYFDYKDSRRRTIKRNIDAHSDWIPVQVDPFKKYKKSRINFANHMSQSEYRHKFIPQFAIPESNKWCANDEVYEHLCKGVSKGWIKDEQLEYFQRYFLRSIVDLLHPFPKNYNIHLSIDFDSVPFFPSQLSQWICAEGFSINDIKKAVLLAKETGNLVRVDLGGCMERLPLFNYEKIDNFTSPGFGISYSLGLHHGGTIYLCKGKRRRMPQKIIDRICSYVVSCYAFVLEAALFD
ncbi:MAG: hypothetical protein QW153_03825 [Candidatus Bilamarchaeaceae archaeon]